MWVIQWDFSSHNHLKDMDHLIIKCGSRIAPVICFICSLFRPRLSLLTTANAKVFELSRSSCLFTQSAITVLRNGICYSLTYSSSRTVFSIYYMYFMRCGGVAVYDNLQRCLIVNSLNAVFLSVSLGII